MYNYRANMNDLNLCMLKKLRHRAPCTSSAQRTDADDVDVPAYRYDGRKEMNFLNKDGCAREEHQIGGS